MAMINFVRKHLWSCESCGAKLTKPRWASYAGYEKLWRKHHAENRTIVDGWARAAKDPKCRCPRCGGISKLPTDLGMPCFSCSMRYSPVTKRRFKPMREYPYSTEYCEVDSL